MNRILNPIGADEAEEFRYDPESNVPLMDQQDFSNLSDVAAEQFLNKYLFSSVEEIPLCSKYSRLEYVDFIQTDEIYDDYELVPLEVALASVINHFGTDSYFLDLHPIRYDQAKRDISVAQSIPMPRILYSHNSLNFDDGRHRLIALYKYGFEKGFFNVPAHQYQTCLGLFSSAIDSL